MGRLVVDSHLHVWEAARSDRPRVGSPRPWTPESYTAVEARAEMTANSVDRGVLIPPSFIGTDNSYVLEAARESGGALVAYCRVDPYDARIHELLPKLEREGCRGIRLTFPQIFEGDALSSPRLAPFWKCAQELNLAVALYTPFHLDDVPVVAARYPKLTLIVDHLGAAIHPGVSDPFAGLNALLRSAESPRVFTKLSGVCEISVQEFPYRDVHRSIHLALDAFGAARIAWGSDFPVAIRRCNYGQSLHFITEALADRVDQNEMNMILGGTMESILGGC